MDRYGIVWDELMHRISLEPVFFCQVGANDGALHDPISSYVRKFHWAGVLIEPVPIYFEKLQNNYKDCPDLTLLNIAISPDKDDVNLQFYSVENVNNAPHDYFSGLSSFDKNVILSHTKDYPELEGYIREIFVRCRTLDSVLHEMHVKQLDLVVVDAEGFDGQIVRSFPFERFLPKIVYFEDKHLSPDDSAETLALLRRHNYSIIRLDWNWCAIRSDIMQARDAALLNKFLI